MGAAHVRDRAPNKVREDYEPDGPLSEKEMQERARRYGPHAQGAMNVS